MSDTICIPSVFASSSRHLFVPLCWQMLMSVWIPASAVRYASTWRVDTSANATTATRWIRPPESAKQSVSHQLRIQSNCLKYEMHPEALHKLTAFLSLSQAFFFYTWFQVTILTIIIWYKCIYLNVFRSIAVTRTTPAYCQKMWPNAWNKSQTT